MYQDSWNGTDFYETLGIKKDADDVQIKKAYRSMARKFHPDTNQDPGAETQFKKVAEAYSVLSDKNKRKSYDSGPQVAWDLGGFGGTDSFDFSKFFDKDGNFSSSTTSMDSDIDDLLGRLNNYGFGSAKSEQKHSTPASDETDDGGGFGARFRDMFDSAKTSLKDRVGLSEDFEVELTFEESVEGVTKDVTLSDGVLRTIRIPAGVKDGQKIRLPNESRIINVAVKPHKRFSRIGDDLVVSLPVSLLTAIQGGVQRVVLPTAGKVSFRLPSNCANRTLKLPGKGFNGANALIQPFIELPSSLNENHVKAAEMFETA